MRKRQKLVKQMILRGRDLYLLAGLPRNTFKFVVNSLQKDDSRSPARYRGSAAPENDWAPIYSDGAIATLLKRAGETLSVDDHKFSPDDPSLPTPRRVVLLYVPAVDAERVLQAVDFFAYTAALKLQPDVPLSTPSDIGWRHHPRDALEIVTRTIDQTTHILNALKAEITDKGLCPLSLPSENFHFPTRDARLAETYRCVRRSGYLSWKDVLLPEAATFSRDDLSTKGFRSGGYRDRFFEDARGLVFPPDPYHGKSRPVPVDGSDTAKTLLLRQRYRFGVYVRDGNLHYDAQYRHPRTLKDEVMHCGMNGIVKVSGTHANIGVNDVIWTPDGSCTPDAD